MLRFALTALLLTSALAPTAHAGPVVLTAESGGFDVVGSLKSFDGSTYVLETSAGEMRLAANAYTCSGTTCPSVAAPAAASKPPVNRTPSLTIRGSNTIGAELFPAIIRAFGGAWGASVEEHVGTDHRETMLEIGREGAPDQITIALGRSGSKGGITALIKGETDIALADRGLFPEEIAQLASPPGQPPRIATHVLGLDGVVVIVGPGVRTKTLTAEQVAGIFSGRITDWSALGLKAGAIKVYAPEAGQGTLDMFERSALAPFGAVVGNTVVRLGSNNALADAVARDPNGIGITSLSFATNAQMVDIVTACGLVSTPSTFALKAEEYALSRRLNIFSRATGLSPHAQALLSYALSDNGQKIVSEHQFVDQTVMAVPFAHEAARVRMGAAQSRVETLARNKLASDLGDKQRLSITFRFASGTSTLDPRSRQDVSRLIEFMRRQGATGKPMLLAGFSDALGTPGPNQILSQKRAEQVRATLLTLGAGVLRPEQVAARGYGPLAPIVCHDQPGGADINRRVEVWISQ